MLPPLWSLPRAPKRPHPPLHLTPWRPRGCAPGRSPAWRKSSRRWTARRPVTPLLRWLWSWQSLWRKTELGKGLGMMMGKGELSTVLQRTHHPWQSVQRLKSIMLMLKTPQMPKMMVGKAPMLALLPQTSSCKLGWQRQRQPVSAGRTLLRRLLPLLPSSLALRALRTLPASSPSDDMVVISCVVRCGGLVYG